MFIPNSILVSLNSFFFPLHLFKSMQVLPYGQNVGHGIIFIQSLEADNNNGSTEYECDHS